MVNLLKILVAVALVAFVLSNVSWRDRYQIVEKKGKDSIVHVEQPGSIRGDWRADPLRFVPEGQEAEIDPRDRLAEFEGAKFELRPGLPTYLRAMDLLYFFLGSLGFFVGVFVGSLRWHWLLRVNELGVSWSQAFRLTWIGIFFNNVVPGLTGGDLVKAFYIARITGKKTRSVLTVIVDRVMGLVALAVLTGIVVFWRVGDLPMIAYGVWAGLLGLLLASTFVLSRRLRSMLKVDRILRRLPGSRLLMSIDESLYLYRSHLPGLFFWMAASVLNHVVMVGGIYLIGEALGVGASPLDYLILVPVIQIASAVPLAPAGWGVGEALFGYLFSHYAYQGLPMASVNVGAAIEVMRTRAIALSIVYRVQIMLWSLLGALFLAFQKGRASSEEMSQLMNDLDEEEPGSAGRA